MQTITIENQTFTGEWEGSPNGLVYRFKLSNGSYLSGFYKQGYSGQTPFQMPIEFNKNKKLERQVLVSGRKVKDPYAYFLHL